MKATSTARERRAPVSRDRYRAVARRSGITARLRRYRPLDLAILVVAAVFVFVAAPWAGDAAAGAARSIGSGVGQLIPSAQGSRTIDLPSGAGTVTAAPVAQGLPDFTREAALSVTGRVPDFAQAPGRTIEVSLNGTPVATLTPDPAGGFSTSLVLRDGSNALALTLRSGSDAIAASSYVVILKRTPPALTLSKPSAGALVDGPNIAVEGKAEPGATIAVNERAVVPSPDGSFSTAVTLPAGPQTITVVATDRAGNQTTTKTGITVRDVAGSVTVAVTLASSQVAPAAPVNATIRVTANGLPRSDQLVTVQVGLYTIGSVRTDATGTVTLGFAAPPNAGEFVVLALTDGGSGRTTLTVAK